MKMLLDETVYEVSTHLLMSWLNMTPKFRDELRGRWQEYAKETKLARGGSLTAVELGELMESFYSDNQDWYYQLMFEVMMDLRNTMGIEEFEEYRTDMTPEELEKYVAEGPTVTAFAPTVKEPIKIPITSED